MTSFLEVDAWSHIEQICERSGTLEVPCALMVHPASCGFRRGLGLPKGQSADWRRRLSGDRCLHVREYSDRYEAHIDRLDPQADPLGHVAVDCAPLWIAGWAIAGAAVTRTTGGAISYALVGGALSALREIVRNTAHRDEPIAEGGRA